MIANWKYVACLGFVAAGSSFAQTKVTVDLSKPINILTDTAVGYDAAMYSGDVFNPAGVPYLKAAGVTAPRYPGNHGVADLYHWETRSLTKYKGTEAGYVQKNSDFASFAETAEKLGNAVIVVNYGTNADGTGGGVPEEAAAWVAYANGDPEDHHPLGKDKAGNDWQTVGYWAGLRASDAQMNDDGMNSLRIHHVKPFGFKLWQIGDQLYNNGYLGGDQVGNPDLHGPAPTALKDFAKLKKDPALSPAAIAENVKAFAKAMKGADPSIQIGVGVAPPPTSDKGKFAVDWDYQLMKGACASVDFVSLDWEVGGVAPPDYKVLDEQYLFGDTKTQIGTIISGMLDSYKGTCPAGHTPRIALSLADIITWPKVDHPAVKAVWVADTYALLAEAGFLNVDWPAAYSDDMMSTDRKKFGPVYYGLQMLHIVAHNPGDAFVEVKSSADTLGVHAVRRRDGLFGLMLVNLDPKSPATVTVSLKGGSVATTGKRFDYGPGQLTAGAGLASTAFTGAADGFTVTVPAYTVTDILLPMAK